MHMGTCVISRQASVFPFSTRHVTTRSASVVSSVVRQKNKTSGIQYSVGNWYLVLHMMVEM